MLACANSTQFKLAYANFVSTAYDDYPELIHPPGSESARFHMKVLAFPPIPDTSPDDIPIPHNAPRMITHAPYDDMRHYPTPTHRPTLYASHMAPTY